MRILVSILTTGTRNETLVECIESIFRQKGIDDATFDILVVENNLNEDAALKQIILPYTLKYENFNYCLENTLGIPFARNRAIMEGRRLGFSHLAFIDDDAFANEDWLAQLISVVKSQNCEVVTGPQIPIFPESTKTLFTNAEIYHERKCKDLSRLSWAATNNVLFDLNYFTDNSLEFNNDLIHGGEDKELFLRASAKGANIVWSSEAVVKEFVSPNRLFCSWALKRNFRIGATGFIIESSNKSKFMAICTCLFKSICYFSRGIIRMIPFSFAKSRSILSPLCDIAHSAGFIYGLFTKGKVSQYT